MITREMCPRLNARAQTLSDLCNVSFFLLSKTRWLSLRSIKQPNKESINQTTNQPINMAAVAVAAVGAVAVGAVCTSQYTYLPQGLSFVRI